MTTLIILFGLFSGCLLSVLVGLLGSKRNIGFGWAFILSLIFTPLVGLIITLLSSEKNGYEEKNYGCIGTILGILGLIFLLLCVLLFFGVVAI